MDPFAPSLLLDVFCSGNRRTQPNDGYLITGDTAGGRRNVRSEKKLVSEKVHKSDLR